MTNILLPASEATLEQSTYRIDAWPAQLALVGAVMALAFFVLFVLDARKRPGALVNPLALASFVVPFTLLGLFTTLRDMPYLKLFGGSDPRATTRVFAGAIHAEAFGASLGLGIVVASALLLGFRAGGRVQLLRFFVPAVALGLALLPAAIKARELIAVGSLPFYAVNGGMQMHAGRERDVPVRLMHPPYSHWLLGTENGPQPLDEPARNSWSPLERVHVKAPGHGLVPFKAMAHRGPVTLTTELSVEAVAETASPLFSLRVGDHYTYRVRARSSDGSLLYFLTLSGSESIHELTVDVTGTRSRDGFRTFVLAVRREDELTEVEVVALAGETRVFDGATGTVGAPIVAFAAESSGPDPVPCTFALLDAAHALCQRGGNVADVAAPAAPIVKGALAAKAGGSTKDTVGHPPVEFAAAAPMAFERSTQSTGGGIATVFVAIVTIGLVILPDGSSSSSYTLVSTHRGAEGAPEALPY